jgi:hypothetical protein
MNRNRARDSVNAKYGSGTWDYSFNGVDETKLYKMHADLIAQVEASGFLVGDINGDGVVDVSDLLRFALAWGSSVGDPNYDADCDLNHDNTVDVADLLLLAGNFGDTMPVP